MKPMKRILLVLAFLVLMVPVPEANAAGYQVHMSGYAFEPAQLSLKAGDTVTWTNHDQAPHNAVVTSGPAQFQSPMLSTGQSWSFTFSQPGTYSYYCSVHPDMRAQLAVQAVQQAVQPAQTPQQTTTKRQPTVTTRPTTTNASAGVAPPPVATDTTEPETEPTITAAAPVQQKPTLDPLLLVAGLVAGVATLCLLLIGSRSAAS
jgi:amicyanin